MAKDFKSITEIIKNCVEIIAIIFAGIWAIFTFIIKDSPNLRKATECDTEIQIDSLDSEKITIEVTAKFKNTGEQTINIDSTKIEYWLIQRDSILKKDYFSADDLIRTAKPDYWVKFESLSGNYSPEQEYSQYFDFFLPRDSTKTIVFKTHYYISWKDFFSRDTASVYSYNYRFKCVPD